MVCLLKNNHIIFFLYSLYFLSFLINFFKNSDKGHLAKKKIGSVNFFLNMKKAGGLTRRILFLFLFLSCAMKPL